MNAPFLGLGLILLATASAAVAATPACVPTVEQGWIRAAPPGATMLAGYAVVRNQCDGQVWISGASASGFAMSSLHETVVTHGVSRMRRARAVPVPAGGVLRMRPGEKHMMLMHPQRVLKPGDRTRVSLQLKDGRRISAMFEVRTAAPPSSAR